MLQYRPHVYDLKPETKRPFTVLHAVPFPKRIVLVTSALAHSDHTSYIELYDSESLKLLNKKETWRKCTGFKALDNNTLIWLDNDTNLIVVLNIETWVIDHAVHSFYKNDCWPRLYLFRTSKIMCVVEGGTNSNNRGILKFLEWAPDKKRTYPGNPQVFTKVTHQLYQYRHDELVYGKQCQVNDVSRMGICMRNEDKKLLLIIDGKERKCYKFVVELSNPYQDFILNVCQLRKDNYLLELECSNPQQMYKVLQTSSLGKVMALNNFGFKLPQKEGNRYIVTSEYVLIIVSEPETHLKFKFRVIVIDRFEQCPILESQDGHYQNGFSMKWGEGPGLLYLATFKSSLNTDVCLQTVKFEPRMFRMIHLLRKGIGLQVDQITQVLCAIDYDS